MFPEIVGSVSPQSFFTKEYAQFTRNTRNARGKISYAGSSSRYVGGSGHYVGSFATM
jgi:hypothetical protein